MIKPRQHAAPMAVEDLANERKFSSWFPTSSTRKTLGEVSSFAAVNTETVPYSLHIGWYGKNYMAGRVTVSSGSLS